MKYQCFYLSTIRCLFGMVRKNSTDLSQHHADHDLSVRENTLCVMSGAPLGGLALATGFDVVEVTHCWRLAGYGESGIFATSERHSDRGTSLLP